MVNAGGEKIFSDDSMPHKSVICHIPIPNRRSIRQGIDGEKWQNGFVDARHGVRIESSGDGLWGSAE